MHSGLDRLLRRLWNQLYCCRGLSVTFRSTFSPMQRGKGPVVSQYCPAVQRPWQGWVSQSPVAVLQTVPGGQVAKQPPAFRWAAEAPTPAAVPSSALTGPDPGFTYTGSPGGWGCEGLTLVGSGIALPLVQAARSKDAVPNVSALLMDSPNRMFAA